MYKRNGRMQILACKDIIFNKIDQGYTYVDIYDELASQGKITIAYNNFRIHINKIKANTHHTNRHNLTTSLPSTRASVSNVSGNSSSMKIVGSSYHGKKFKPYIPPNARDDFNDDDLI